MFFAAREAVRRRARQRYREEMERGRREERAYIAKLAADTGATIPPELVRYLAGCGCCDDTPGGNRAGGGQGAP